MLEGLACARPVVATRVGGPPEVITPECGVLVDPLDVDSIAAGMRAAAALPVPCEAAVRAASKYAVATEAARIEAVLARAAQSALLRVRSRPLGRQPARQNARISRGRRRRARASTRGRGRAGGRRRPKRHVWSSWEVTHGGQASRSRRSGCTGGTPMRRRRCPRCRRSGLGRADVADGRGRPGDRVRTRPDLHRRRFHARPRSRGSQRRCSAEPSRGAGRGHRGAPPVEPERERAGARAAHEAGIEHHLRRRCVHEHRWPSARADRGHRHQRRDSAQVESGGRRPRGRDRGDAEARLYRRGLRHRRRGAPARRCRRQLRLRRPSAGVEPGCPRRRDARARARLRAAAGCSSAGRSHA